MFGSDLWLVWVRGSLLAALCGHWVANLLFDRGVAAGPFEPTAPFGLTRGFLIQSIVVASIVLILRPGLRLFRVPEAADLALHRMRPSRVLTRLIAAQVGLFLLLEGSERLVQHELLAGGWVSKGFLFESILALAVALLLTMIGMVAVRVARSSRPRASSGSTMLAVRLACSRVLAFRMVHIPAGGVRAPPVLLVPSS